ncbi:hypothetical protein DMA12_42540 [Amycolatopsis balhimycina DSM 5908]|uniref:Uncharacterized protein n=1 Tax=Amycolatopsis balhimycina DSM 5908 TaxID=1081091 RepID=A0A428VYI6_AMYBA|nr:hypothetical protein [Amycolatopsis balhimycina]RSM35877.1 hypothetical protein DMA12_42540 [Amycolatopsis balhimycina DSM 5908]
MSPLSARIARALGGRLRAAGFHSLPDVADDGELIGTRLWRLRAGHVEYLALRPNGLAHAVRAKATFDFRRLTEHGPVIEHRSGHAVSALNWLLTSTELPSGDLPRPYAAPDASDEPGGGG